MGFKDKKGITVASGFKLQAAALLDARGQVKTIAERDELVTLNAVTPGLRVYVEETKTSYVYNGSGWDELTKGAGYTHPNTPGNKHIPAGGVSGQVLGWSADGQAKWVEDAVDKVKKVKSQLDKIKSTKVVQLVVKGGQKAMKAMGKPL